MAHMRKARSGCDALSARIKRGWGLGKIQCLKISLCSGENANKKRSSACDNWIHQLSKSQTQRRRADNREWNHSYTALTTISTHIVLKRFCSCACPYSSLTDKSKPNISRQTTDLFFIRAVFFTEHCRCRLRAIKSAMEMSGCQIRFWTNITHFFHIRISSKSNSLMSRIPRLTNRKRTRRNESCGHQWLWTLCCNVCLRAWTLYFRKRA